MPAVEAIYQGGVFKPLGKVLLSENQRVVLDIETVVPEEAAAWLAEVQALQKRFVAAHGYLPDSTLDIAADRVRDD